MLLVGFVVMILASFAIDKAANPSSIEIDDGCDSVNSQQNQLIYFDMIQHISLKKILARARVDHWNLIFELNSLKHY